MNSTKRTTRGSMTTAFRAVRQPKSEIADRGTVRLGSSCITANLAVEDVEGGEQGRGAVTFVIMGHRAATAALYRQSRLGCGRGPGFGSSHRPTAPGHGPAD